MPQGDSGRRNFWVFRVIGKTSQPRRVLDLVCSPTPRENSKRSQAQDTNERDAENAKKRGRASRQLDQSHVLLDLPCALWYCELGPIASEVGELTVMKFSSCLSRTSNAFFLSALSLVSSLFCARSSFFTPSSLRPVSQYGLWMA